MLGKRAGHGRLNPALGRVRYRSMKPAGQYNNEESSITYRGSVQMTQPKDPCLLEIRCEETASRNKIILDEFKGKSIILTRITYF